MLEGAERRRLRDGEVPVARARGGRRVSVLLEEFGEDQRLVDHLATERCSKRN